MLRAGAGDAVEMPHQGDRVQRRRSPYENRPLIRFSQPLVEKMTPDARAILKSLPRAEKAHNQKPKDNQRDQNNLQIESPHSTLVRPHPTDLAALRRSPFRSADQSISFHMVLLSA